MHAARNVSLCTKDCVCLFVCPSGATDTETGQIDESKCIMGCRLCVDACPSHAIYLVSDTYPEPQTKPDSLRKALFRLAATKSEAEAVTRVLAVTADTAGARRLARAFERSNRLMTEDCLREAGYLLPQSKAVKKLLKAAIDSASGGFPLEAAERLLELL